MEGICCLSLGVGEYCTADCRHHTAVVLKKDFVQYYFSIIISKRLRAAYKENRSHVLKGCSMHGVLAN